MSKNALSKEDFAPSVSETPDATPPASAVGTPTRFEGSPFFRLFLILLPLLLLAAFFLPSVSPDVRFSYRDVAYYYYPLFEQIQRCWESERLPLWNPYVNLGQPLAGDPTSSVFYPGKALFFLSSLGLCSYPLCFKLYLWLHVAFAFFTSRSLARSVGVSRVGAVISGMAYAFSGQVLFQYTNVIYLVGAAWAPLLFRFARQYFVAADLRGRLRAIILLSVASTAAVLGGEPQIVYLTLLCSGIVGLFVQPVPESDSQDAGEPRSSRAVIFLKSHRFANVLVFILAASSATLAFSAIQILPSMELISRSTRANDDLPRSLWDVPRAYAAAQARGEKDALFNRGFYEGILCEDISRQGRNSSVYRFSVGPWRWLEYLTPYAGGKQYPQSARWFEIFPEELSLWTPTLYFGVVPLLLALAAASLRRRPDTPKIAVAASWLVLFGLFGALGGYGVVWTVRFLSEIFAGTKPSPVFTDGDPVGGLYWFLNLLAPKFAEFRYPAKLLTLSAVGFSVLAGLGWDHKRFSPAFRRLLGVAVAATTFLLLGAACFGSDLLKEVSIPSNPLFGPFQESIARKAILQSSAQTLLVLFLAGILTTCLNHAERTARNITRSKVLTTAFLILVAGDLFAANRNLVVVSPSKVFNHVVKSDDVNSAASPKSFMESLNASNDAVPPTRVYRYPIWFPPLFQQESSPRRMEERVLWDVNTLYPMYPTQENVALLDVRGAVMESAFARFIDAAVGKTQIDADLAFLDVHYVLGPKFWVERISPSKQAEDVGASATDWQVEFKTISATPTRAALVRDGERVDFGENDRLVCLAYEPDRISFLVDASQDSELIVSEQYWPDWEASIIPVDAKLCLRLLDARYRGKEINALVRRALEEARKSKPGSIQRTKTEPVFEFLRKTHVKQGRYCVVLSYKPRKLRLGAAVSAAAWTTLLLGYGALWVRRRRAQPCEIR